MTEPIDTTETLDTPEPEGEPELVSDEERVRLDLERQLSDTTEERDTLRGTLARREQTIADLQLAALKRDIADETGVTADLLSGKNREELTAHADKLKAWARTQQKGPTGAYRGPLRSGTGGFIDDRSVRAQAALAVQLTH